MKIRHLVSGYLEELVLLNRSLPTIKNIRNVLLQMLRFFDARGIVLLEQLTRDVLALYQEELTYRLTPRGQQLSARSREKYLCTVRGFAGYLYEKDYLAVDLGKSIKLPSQPKPLPRVILDTDEIKELLKVPDMRCNSGYRNRIILEILYDTGVRAAEMAAIQTADLDLPGGYLYIRQGKGAKDRVVPLSSRVASLVGNYLLMIRPAMIRKGSSKDHGYLVVNRWGGKMTPTAVWAVVKRCAKLSKLTKNVTTHTFRHSCATHMLKNGAPIRHIQELLGHESLESTQIYTRVTINDLKKIHARYHPSEQL